MPTIFPLERLFLRTLGKLIPSDFFSRRHPVSVKGVCFVEEKVVLLKNERGEWDLPGGKLKKNEPLEVCLQREMMEELQVKVQIHKLLDVVLVRIMDFIGVVVVIYFCHILDDPKQIKLSHESFDLGFFSIAELDDLTIPEEYRRVIRKVFENQALYIESDN